MHGYFLSGDPMAQETKLLASKLEDLPSADSHESDVLSPRIMALFMTCICTDDDVIR